MSGIPAWAVRGAKVVCVDASNRPGFIWCPGEALAEGAVYTISETWVSVAGNANCILEEIKRSAAAIEYAHGDRVGYHLRRFRPAVPPRTLEQDISIFKPLLIPDKELSDA